MVSEQGSHMKLSSVCQLAPFTILRPSPSSSRSSLEMMLTSAHSGVWASLQAPHRCAELRHRVAKCRRRELLIPNAEHEIVVQDSQQRRPRRRIGQLVEIEAAHGRSHVAAELFCFKTHGVAPDTQDNVRAHAMNLKRRTR
jgi:hypothetical protein